MSKLRLLTRLALAILLAGSLFGAVAAYSLFHITLNNEIDEANLSIEQLFNTISPTASIAAYFEDPELANEVVNGLETNDSVDRVVFEAGKLLSGDNSLASQAVLTFEVEHPFLDDSKVGKIKIFPDFGNIRRNAVDIAYNNALTLMVMVLAMTVLVIVICYWLITRPMVATGQALHHITPGTNSRLNTPKSHEFSEIGQLVDDVNQLLEKAELQLIKERELRNQIEKLEQRFRLLFENSVAPIVLLNERGDLVLKNSAYVRLIQHLTGDDSLNQGELLSTLFVDSEDYESSMHQQLDTGDLATGEYRLKTQNDATIWMQVVITKIYSDDFQSYFQVTMHDITKRRQQLDALSIQAHVDALTGLRNRAAAEKQILEKIHQSTPFALVLIDLNGFKQVNDVYGHDAGDEVLQYVAGLMQKAIRKNDLASRWGGDEFVYLLDDIDKEAVNRILIDFRTELIKPIAIKQASVEVNIGASMGVAFYPQTSHEMESLIRRADKAMYRAKALKHSDPSQFIFFAEGD